MEHSPTEIRRGFRTRPQEAYFPKLGIFQSAVEVDSSEQVSNCLSQSCGRFRGIYTGFPPEVLGIARLTEIVIIKLFPAGGPDEDVVMVSRF